MRQYGPTLFNERIDQVCVKAYGTSSNDLVIFLIEANPGLENNPLLLPAGLMINVPDLPENDDSEPIRAQIKLWD